MEDKSIQKPAEFPVSGRHVEREPGNQPVPTSGARLSLLEAIQAAKEWSLRQPGQLGGQAGPPGTTRPQAASGTINRPARSTIHRQRLLTPEVIKALKEIAHFQPGQSVKPLSHNRPSLPASPPEIRFSTIPTEAVIASLLKVKKNKGVKESTLNTYEKHWGLFRQRFAFLPENPEAIMDYLSRFNGASGRHRRNHQDLLNMLYVHATRRFGLKYNPVAELERPLVTHKPVKTLSLEQLRALNPTPEDLMERTALDLLSGHGWRQIEVRRVQAKDVAAIDKLLILCHGKERDELAPVLPETVDRLREMARDLQPDDYLFVARQKRHGRRAPLGEDGMSQLIGRLFNRAGLKGFTGHDLRRTFATLVTAASRDEFLAMRLMRDTVPGQSNRYIRYPLDQLVEALQKYSPLRQAGEIPTSVHAEAGENNLTPIAKDSPVSETGESLNTTPDEREKGLVETGEGPPSLCTTIYRIELPTGYLPSRGL